MEISETALSTYRIDDDPRSQTKISRASGLFKPDAKFKGKRTNPSQLIYLGGPTGAGKTVLGTLYSNDEGISFHAGSLARESGIALDPKQLRKDLKRVRQESVEPHQVFVRLVPKFTSRVPRSTEVNGVDFYFVSDQDIKSREANLAFTYRYPQNVEGERGALYGVPMAVRWPLKYHRDSLTTAAGYEAFAKFANLYPSAVGIWIDANLRDIEAHIKGRAASDAEKAIRLKSFPGDRQQFHEHHQDVPYSVFISSLKSLRRDITPDRYRALLQEMDVPLRQIKAIVEWERYLKKQKYQLTGEPQQRFDQFLDTTVKAIFNGMGYEELADRVRGGNAVRFIELDEDIKLLERYSADRGISKNLLEDIAKRTKVTAVLDANGRRTIVLSPYSPEYISSVNATEKRVIVELLAKKLNGFGAHLSSENPGEYKPVSLLSLVKSECGMDEALFVYLSSDHVPVMELDRPRALNFVFSGSSNITALTLDEIVKINMEVAHDETTVDIFRRAVQL